VRCLEKCPARYQRGVPERRAPALEGIYERHRKRIQEAAARKHRAQQFDKPGIILIRRQDVAD